MRAFYFNIIMQYFATIESINQHTMQLQNVPCSHCGKVAQLVSHGFIYKDQSSRTCPAPVGKRVFCSNRYGRTGCGRTMRLYLSGTIRYLHYAGCIVVAFVLVLMQGASIAKAYHQITGTPDARNAYRWLHKLMKRIDHFRSVFSLDSVDDIAQGPPTPASERRGLLTSTFALLMAKLQQPLCAAYQLSRQISII